MKQGTLVNPEGVFYMTSNSATGSKFYNLIEHSYSPPISHISSSSNSQIEIWAVICQTWRPTYSVINITDDKFTINTYDAQTGTPIDEAYSIIKR